MLNFNDRRINSILGRNKVNQIFWNTEFTIYKRGFENFWALVSWRLVPWRVHMGRYHCTLSSPFAKFQWIEIHTHSALIQCSWIKNINASDVNGGSKDTERSKNESSLIVSGAAGAQKWWLAFVRIFVVSNPPGLGGPCSWLQVSFILKITCS